MPNNQNAVFFHRLKQKNKLFFIALHFCNKKHRYTIAALIGLYSDLMTLFMRIKEPLAIQMRLCWWQSQFESSHFFPAPLPEISLLKNYAIIDLLHAIEYEYIHNDPFYAGKSELMLYKIIADIMEYPDYAQNAGQYGYYNALKNKINIVIPTDKIPFELRFLRIPIILQQKKQNIFSLFYYFIKNFLI